VTPLATPGWTNRDRVAPLFLDRGAEGSARPEALLFRAVQETGERLDENLRVADGSDDRAGFQNRLPWSGRALPTGPCTWSTLIPANPAASAPTTPCPPHPRAISRSVPPAQRRIPTLTCQQC
jgi:hypothetical protein